MTRRDDVDKVSERLRRLVARGDEASTGVKVRLRAGMTPAQIRKAVRNLSACLDGAEYVPISGTVHGSARPAVAADASGIPDVEWVDIEPTAAVEELIDS